MDQYENRVPNDGMNRKLLDDALAILDEIEAVDKELEFRRVMDAVRRRRRIRMRRWIGGAAAAAVVIAAVVLAATPTQMPAPEVVKLVFADGSVAEIGDGKDQPLVPLMSNVVMTLQGNSLTLKKRDTTNQQQVAAEPTLTTLIVPMGSVYDITLEDGSRIWLNSDTRLQFPVVFSGSERRVHLEGEAYFDISPDSARPFVVDAQGQSATVLGTEFNISAYPEQGSVVTALVEGSLRVAATGGGGTAAVVLTPGQQARFDKQQGTIVEEQAEMGNILAWRNGLLNIDKMTLEEALTVVSRRYGVSFVYPDDLVRGIRFRGTIPAYNDVEDVLGAIELSGPVRFDKGKNEIIVEHK